MVNFVLNGEAVQAEDASMTLLDFLRLQRGLTGTKEGCNEGDCGACTVQVAALESGKLVHRAMNSCILLMGQMQGKSVTTVEALGGDHPVQKAMVEHHGSQCGFCTPGIVMSLAAAHIEGRQDHADVLAGNLCRCTGYTPILRAAEAVATQPVPAGPDEAALISGLAGEGFTDLDEFANWYVENPDAVLVGGATEVGLVLTKELKQPEKFAFLGQIAALQNIEHEIGGMRIGAGVLLARMRGAMAGKYPQFAEMLRRFGSVQVRNSATIGGNIANGSPIADTPPALIALEASVTLRKGSARREILLEDFYLSYGVQDRAEGEFVESVFIPEQENTLGVYKISKRFDQDISALCGAFNIAVSDGIVTKARIAFGGMAATPKRANAVEAALLGQPWNEATIATAQAAFAEDYTPMSDQRGSAAYRMILVQNLLQRFYLEQTGAGRVRVVGGPS
ncbi:MAG: xanthine dehydrogenase small subunit [Rhodobacteraceae bacterium]|nr:xanthine dehydrogenase small subunit [Paracoccaceae bacterium]